MPTLQPGANVGAPATPPPLRRQDWFLIVALAAAKLAAHAYSNPAYGLFRDELYYLACGRHLDWGYVDMAPLAAVYARAAIALGGSLFAIRAIAACAGAGVVALTMAMAHALGGRRFAMGMAGLAVLVSPVYLATDSFLSMNAFEPLYWMGCVYVLIRLVRGGDRRLWLLFGLLAGLGLENKHSTLLFGTAVVLALLLSPQRRAFLAPWLWAGGAVAALVFLPNVLWQAAHGFPTLEDLRNVQATGKNVVLSPTTFILRQMLQENPILVPLWLAGIWHYLAGRGRPFRVLGWTYVILLAILIALKGKDYYLAPIYPLLFASGAVALEHWLQRIAASRWRRGLRAVLPAAIVLGSVPSTLLTLPMLSPEEWIAFATAVHFPIPRNETHEQSRIPQWLADRTGWERLAQEVLRVYAALPLEERGRTAVYARNYGGAAAIDWYGPALGLPPAFTGHQNYYYWGPPDGGFTAFIVVGALDKELIPFCGEVTEVGRHDNPNGMGTEDRPIFLCRNLKQPMAEIWPRLKFWN